MIETKRELNSGSSSSKNGLTNRSTATSKVSSLLEKASELASAAAVDLAQKRDEILYDLQPPRQDPSQQPQRADQAELGALDIPSKSFAARPEGKKVKAPDKSTVKGFGQYAGDMRRKHRMTQNEVASLCRKSQSWYSEFELGRIEKPDLGTLLLLSSIFDLSPEEFLDRSPFAALYRAKAAQRKAGFCQSTRCFQLKIERRGEVMRLRPYYHDLSADPLRLLCPDCGSVLKTSCHGCKSPIAECGQRYCACGFFHYISILKEYDRLENEAVEAWESRVAAILAQNGVPITEE